MKLDPTFEKAKILLERINALGSDKSLGEKMEEALDKKEEKDKTKDKKNQKENTHSTKTSIIGFLQSLFSNLPIKK